MSAIQKVRVQCPDPRYRFSDIGLHPTDLVVPVLGVYLGGAKAVLRNFSEIPGEKENSLFVFTPHHPCAAVPNAATAMNLGINYAECLTHNGFRAVSLFLGSEAVMLHDPICDTNDPVVQGLFIDASHAQRQHYNVNPGVTVGEVAIAPFFSIQDLRDGVLYLSSMFFGMKGLKAVKDVLGGVFPHRNYDSKIPRQTQDLFEAAFAAA